MFRPSLKSVASPVHEIVAIRVLAEGCEPQSWNRRPYGGGDGIVRKSVGEFL